MWFDSTHWANINPLNFFIMKIKSYINAIKNNSFEDIYTDFIDKIFAIDMLVVEVRLQFERGTIDGDTAIAELEKLAEEYERLKEIITNSELKSLIIDKLRNMIDERL